MHIGIYINNKDIASIDCKNLMAGNPGIGGTEYCILLLARAYKMSYPENKVTLFVAKNSVLPEVDNYITVKRLEELPLQAKRERVDVLVVSAVYNGMPLPQTFFDDVNAEKIKTILWGHNFYLSDFCNKICKCEYIKANVFVGRQQYDRYVDHAVIKKSTYIFNMYPVSNEKKRNYDFQPSVTYIGSLVPLKGFQVLAAAWKCILSQVPTAQLNVIGSGKLYNRNERLGRFGIAEENFENEFMQGLIDENGNILSSVHFYGVMGSEKKNVIRQTAVGVVNPSGKTETFGISALDFESCGVPVVTIGKGGFLDTVIDEKTGLLYQKTDDLADCVGSLLRDRDKNIRLGNEGIQLAQSFAPDKIVTQWHDLFKRVCEDQQPAYQPPDNFMKTNLKKYRVLNRRIKDWCGIEYPLSVIGMESFARNILRKFGR